MSEESSQPITINLNGKCPLCLIEIDDLSNHLLSCLNSNESLNQQIPPTEVIIYEQTFIATVLAPLPKLRKRIEISDPQLTAEEEQSLPAGPKQPRRRQARTLVSKSSLTHNDETKLLQELADSREEQQHARHRFNTSMPHASPTAPLLSPKQSNKHDMGSSTDSDSTGSSKSPNPSLSRTSKKFRSTRLSLSPFRSDSSSQSTPPTTPHASQQPTQTETPGRSQRPRSTILSSSSTGGNKLRTVLSVVSLSKLSSGGSGGAGVGTTTTASGSSTDRKVPQKSVSMSAMAPKVSGSTAGDSTEVSEAPKQKEIDSFNQLYYLSSNFNGFSGYIVVVYCLDTDRYIRIDENGVAFADVRESNLNRESFFELVVKDGLYLLFKSKFNGKYLFKRIPLLISNDYLVQKDKKFVRSLYLIDNNEVTIANEAQKNRFRVRFSADVCDSS